MPSLLTKSEALLLAAFIALIGAAVFGPAIAQSPHYHDYADQRMLFGMLYGADVVSNLPLGLVGLLGLGFLFTAPAGSLTNMQRAMALLFCLGLLLVAFGSATYHLAPQNQGLGFERMALAAAAAGLLGLAAAIHVSERAGALLGMASLGAGIGCVSAWQSTGNLLPWAVFQFGAVLMVWWMATLPARGRALQINWPLAIVTYGVAKLLEINDYAVYELTMHTVSGHSLKHVVAAFAAWPVVCALAQARRYSPTAWAQAGEVDFPWDTGWPSAHRG